MSHSPFRFYAISFTCTPVDRQRGNDQHTCLLTCLKLLFTLILGGQNDPANLIGYTCLYRLRNSYRTRVCSLCNTLSSLSSSCLLSYDYTHSIYTIIIIMPITQYIICLWDLPHCVSREKCAVALLLTASCRCCGRTLHSRLLRIQFALQLLDQIENLQRRSHFHVQHRDNFVLGQVQQTSAVDLVAGERITVHGTIVDAQKLRHITDRPGGRLQCGHTGFGGLAEARYDIAAACGDSGGLMLNGPHGGRRKGD